ncbi:MAG: restriction endonuclease subunit S [Cyclobacteriaceae bacterium]|nr:restriction endonuclease subunit S [Cyclobacteriaceae bacterium]
MSDEKAYSEKKKPTAPKLRFKEFKSGWINKKLSDVSVFLDGKRKPIKESDRAKMRGQFPYYGASGIIDFVNDYIFDDEIILLGEDGENIVSRNLPLAFKVVGKCWVNNHAHVIKPNRDTDIDFLTHILEKTNYEIYNTGTAQPKLNQEVCKSIPLNLPTLPEQQKIASFLSEVDEKIQQLTRKKELLEHYKKGVMQQLFSGKLRFKDENGKAYSKWEEKRLGEVSVITMGQSPDSSSYNSEGKGLPLIQGNADISERISNPRQWTSEPTKVCDVGDLLLTVRAPVGSISKSIHKACIGRGVCAIRNNELSDINYLYQVLVDYESKWKRLEQGSTFTAVNGDDIKSIKINVPSPKEQQKIASFLTALDAKIEGVATQITHTQTFKKGLLQQMFV